MGTVRTMAMTACTAQPTVYKALPQEFPFRAGAWNPWRLRVIPSTQLVGWGVEDRKSTPGQKFTYMECLDYFSADYQTQSDTSGQTWSGEPSLLPKGLSSWPWENSRWRGNGKWRGCWWAGRRRLVNWVLGGSVTSNSAAPWTVAHQAPMLLETFQARILEWVAISYSKGSSQSRGRTWVSCIVKRILYP